MKHQPVLLQEVIELLGPRPGEDFIDATFGGGGHALEILKQTAPGGKLLGIDWDSEGLGLETGSENLIASEPLAPTGTPTETSGKTSELSDAKVGVDRSGIEPAPYFAKASQGKPLSKRLFLEHGNFADIDDISNRYFSDGVDGVLFDFGFSSFHIDESGRGFSYSKDEPLDMRYNPESGPAAAEIANTWPERELERIFREFGEERAARKIAQAIVKMRRVRRIATTRQLVAAVGSKDVKTIARVFQALRIAVNDELANIERGLAGAWRILKPGGRLAAISFHSLEDRLVKNFFNGKKQETLGQVLTKKPLIASAEEISRNPRSRSAKLRAIKKIND